MSVAMASIFFGTRPRGPADDTVEPCYMPPLRGFVAGDLHLYYRHVAPPGQWKMNRRVQREGLVFRLRRSSPQNYLQPPAERRPNVSDLLPTYSTVHSNRGAKEQVMLKTFRSIEMALSGAVPSAALRDDKPKPGGSSSKPGGSARPYLVISQRSGEICTSPGGSSSKPGGSARPYLVISQRSGEICTSPAGPAAKPGGSARPYLVISQRSGEICTSPGGPAAKPGGSARPYLVISQRSAEICTPPGGQKV